MRSTIISLALVAGAALALPHTAAAQGRWKEIGKTNQGNIVSFDPRSVKTANGITTARVQVRFVNPVQTPQGAWRLSRSIAMFKCASKTVAAKENIYYGDLAATKILEKHEIKIPGFGPAFEGSMTQVALDYFCSGKK